MRVEKLCRAMFGRSEKMQPFVKLFLRVRCCTAAAIIPYSKAGAVGDMKVFYQTCWLELSRQSYDSDFEQCCLGVYSHT